MENKTRTGSFLEQLHPTLTKSMSSFVWCRNFSMHKIIENSIFKKIICYRISHTDIVSFDAVAYPSGRWLPKPW